MRNQNRFKRQIDSYIREQSDHLEDLLFSHTLAIASPELRRLPILSSVHKGGKVDFEWPSDSEMKDMLKQQMVKLVKLEIWYYSDYNFMTGVRATLSNGEQSPIFKTSGEQMGPFTMEIPQDRRAKKLSIRSEEDGIYGLNLADKYGKEIVEWPGDVTQEWTMQEIPSGENIAGIYGLNGYGGNGIQNFGFLVLSYF